MAREKRTARSRTRSSSSSSPGSLAIQLVAAVAMISIGAYLSISQSAAQAPSLELLVAGTTLGTLGSVLASWVLSGIVEKKSATAELRARLKPISVNVGQYLGSIQSVVRSDWRESDLGGVRRSLREATQGIRLQISHIQSLIGEDYAASETDKTLELLDQHWKKLDAALEEGDKRAVAAARRDLEDQVKRTIQNYDRPTIACPRCGSETQPAIQDFMGATVHVRCERCGHHFPVHRNAAGFVVGGPSFTTQPEASRVRVEVPAGFDVHVDTSKPADHPAPSFLACTDCGSEVPIPHRSRRGTTQLIVCVNCGMSHHRDATGALIHDSRFEIVEVPTRVQAGSRFFSQCPTCATTYPLLVKRGSRRFGFCFADSVVFWSDDPTAAGNVQAATDAA